MSRYKGGTPKSIPKDAVGVIRMAPTAPLSTRPLNLSSFLKTDTCSVLGHQTTEAYATLGTSTALYSHTKILGFNPHSPPKVPLQSQKAA